MNKTEALNLFVKTIFEVAPSWVQYVTIDSENMAYHHIWLWGGSKPTYRPHGEWDMETIPNVKNGMKFGVIQKAFVPEDFDAQKAIWSRCDV